MEMQLMRWITGTIAAALLLLFVAVAAVDCRTVEAKMSYGPCVDYYVGQWYGGEIGGALLFGKIGANCDKTGGWR
jgi:hypothetical protein